MRLWHFVTSRQSCAHGALAQWPIETQLLKQTWLPSNLRQTARECVYSARCGHLRSRDKGRSHAIRSKNGDVESAMLHAIFTALSFIFYKTGVIAHQSLLCGNSEFRALLLLWPWLWPDDLHIRSWPVCSEDVPKVQKWTLHVKAFESYRITYMQADGCHRKHYHAVSV